MGEWYNWVENVFYQGKLNKNHLFYQLYEYVNDPKNIKFWSTAKTGKLKEDMIITTNTKENTLEIIFLIGKSLRSVP